MKCQPLLPTVLLALFTALATNAQAQEKASPAAEVKTDKPAPAQAAKPHSHVQEKTGVPQNAQPAEPGKKNPAKDKSRHYHPRDK